MPKKKTTATKTNPNNPETPVQVLKEANCKTLEGSATLSYQIGKNDTGDIHFKIAENAGGGFFSNECIDFTGATLEGDAELVPISGGWGRN